MLESPFPWWVHLEVIALGGGAEGLAYRVETLSLHEGQTPDVSALRLAWPDGEPPDGGFCHSTSWRLTAPGSILLTYAAGPVELTGAETVLRHPSVLTSGDALHPHPPLLHEHHVVAHAVQHLALLSHRDPSLAPSTAQHPDFWRTVREVAERTPTAEHDAAHALAEGRG